MMSGNQPEFVKLGKYWVVDPKGFLDESTLIDADSVLEQLRLDHIAEVAIVIMTGIKNNGPFDDEKIWARDWGREIKLGDINDKRSIVWLIRPDVDPSEGRVTIEISTHLTKLTVSDYYSILEEAGHFANANNWNEAVYSIVRGTNTVLRQFFNER